MKIVLLADLHGNMVATEAMEHELDSIEPDEVWFLGDAVGKGPESEVQVKKRTGAVKQRGGESCLEYIILSMSFEDRRILLKHY